MVQQIGTCLPRQETGIRSLVQEDPQSKLSSWTNYWACQPQLLSPHAATTEALTPSACAPQQEKLRQWEAHALKLQSSLHLPQLQKAHVQQRRPSPTNKITDIKFKRINRKKTVMSQNLEEGQFQGRNSQLCWMSVTQLCSTLWNPMDCSPPGSFVHRILQARILGLGSRSLLQGLFQTQGWNPGFLHCRWVLYHLSHWGSLLNVTRSK